MSLKNLKNLSPLYNNDKIKEVDFMDNNSAPGFNKQFDTGPTKYKDGASGLDNLPGKYEDGYGVPHQIIYHSDSKYGDIRESPLSKLADSMDDKFGQLQFNPLADDIENYVGEDGNSTISSNSTMTPFNDLPLKKYDEYTFDPREEKTNIFSEGQTDVKFPNPQNPYTGTKFDDPLVEGISGGGLFNTDIDDSKYSNVFRNINKPFMNQIIQFGNVDDLENGYVLSKLSYQKFIDTGGELLGGEDFVLGRVAAGVQTSDADGATLKYTDTSVIIGDSPEGTGNIDLTNSSWFYGGKNVGPNSSNNFPNDNMFYQWSGAPTIGGEDDLKRSISITTTVEGEIVNTQLTSHRLGFGDLTFDTLYNHNHTSKIDDRLFLREGGWNPGMSWRGNEPYIVHNIPKGPGEIASMGEVSEDDFSADAEKLAADVDGVDGNILNFGGRELPLMRGVTDLARLSSMFASGMGMAFWAKQTLLQRLNPRNKRNYNPLSLFSAIPIVGNVHYRMDRAFGFSPLEYINTVYEKSPAADLLGLPPAAVDKALLVSNTAVRFIGDGFQGGIMFQVLGLNKGSVIADPITSMTNVAPPSPTLLDLFGIEQIGSTALQMIQSKYDIFAQTMAGGLPADMNPRALQYVQQRGFTPGAVGPTGPLAAPIPNLDLYPVGGSLKDDPSLDAWNVPGRTGVGQQLDKSQVWLKPFYKIPESVSLEGFEGLGQVYVGATYESQAKDTMQPSLDSKKLRFSTNKELPDFIGPSLPTSHRGDFFTNLPVNPGDSIRDAYGPLEAAKIESNKNGYPFYFKDLRDNTFIFFRGYLDGEIAESVTADWTATSFVGRSEDAHVYQKSNRDISFTLALFAQTRSELDMIYDKISKLTSLCYPQYKFDDINFAGMNKLRSKPPLTKFRLGDLYGGSGSELSGFIKNIQYSFVNAGSTWEHEGGSRVPKQIKVQINYQVLHDKVPNMLTKFYGKEVISNIHHIKESEMDAINKGTS